MTSIEFTDRIKELSAEVCGTTVDLINSRTRKAKPALARQISMYYSSYFIDHLEQTAEIFDRHHTCVIYTRRKIAQMREFDSLIKGMVDQIEEMMPSLREVVRG